MGKRYYVYAITASEMRLPEGVSGFGGPLHILPCGELGAVVSHIQAAAADGSAVDASAENLLRHEAVVEAVRDGGPALPVRFGTVLPDGGAVTQALATHYDTLRDDLRRIGDKIELGVTVLWHPAGGYAAVPTPEPDTDTRSGADAVVAEEARRPGLAYLRSRQIEFRQMESARGRAQTLARELDAALRPYALTCHQSVCPSERLALRNLYLLERERMDAFERALAEVRQRHQAVRFLLSGPWPPYSFVTPSAPDKTDVPLFK